MNKTHYIIPIFVPDLGCPHQCVFCNQKRITGITSVPSGHEVKNKIIEYLKTMPKGQGITREVAFFGGSFTAVSQELQKELLTPAYKFLTNNEIDTIRVSTRPDAITDDVLSLLTAFGVGTVELGVQSMDDEILRKAGRGHTSKDVVKSAALIKSWGLNLGLQQMIGLPGDTVEKDIDTAEQFVCLHPDIVRIYPCLVLNDTQLADLYHNGEFVPLNVGQAVEISKKLLLKFEENGINVIRIGLQPSEQINLEGDVLAGPYHPAFRELVESSVARDQINYILDEKVKLDSANFVEFLVPERDVSIVRGQNGSNIEYFKQKFGLSNFVTTIDSTLSRGTIKLLGIDDKKFSYICTREDIIKQLLKVQTISSLSGTVQIAYYEFYENYFFPFFTDFSINLAIT